MNGNPHNYSLGGRTYDSRLSHDYKGEVKVVIEKKQLTLKNQSEKGNPHQNHLLEKEKKRKIVYSSAV